MENKEMKKPLLNELEDEVLDKVIGGESTAHATTMEEEALGMRGLNCKNYICRFCGYTKAYSTQDEHKCPEMGEITHFCFNCEYDDFDCTRYET